MMKNRMQDLDFEQTVAFDSVKDFEFTRRAAQRFRQVVSLDGFEDEEDVYKRQARIMKEGVDNITGGAVEQVKILSLIHI